MSAPDLSVIVCTHNPGRESLSRTLEGLRAQTLAPANWELIIVDNGSNPPVAAAAADWHPSSRVVREGEIGLTPARLRGISEARAPLLVFVDDDNILDSGYLANVARLFAAHPRLGSAGGSIAPEWKLAPPAWMTEFIPLLAVRDLGSAPLLCAGGPGVGWPAFAPVGAGLAVRRAGAVAYANAVARDPTRRALDRAGGGLGSGGDNDLVFSLLQQGGDAGYFPELRLTHLIPAGRLDPEYLGRLNEGIMRTWVIVLHLHHQCPWPPIPPWSVPLRRARAWFRLGAWRSPANRIRWRGACGQFAGQAAIGGI